MTNGRVGDGGASRGDGFSRRRFLTIAGGGTAGLVWEFSQLDGTIRLAEHVLAPISPPGEVGGQLGLNVITRTIRRPLDQLNLQMAFVGWRLVRSGGQSRLVREVSSAPVVVTFPPQAIGEETYTPFNEQSFLVPAPGARRARISQPSRLVFDVPSTVTELPANDTEALLNWRAWVLRVVPNALSNGPPSGRAGPARPRAPEGFETSLELPWFLVLSPSERTTFIGSGTPVLNSGRVEAWHTRLATRILFSAVTEARTSSRSVRAVWARDTGMTGYVSNPDNNPLPDESPGAQGYPFRMPMTPNDRGRIVLQSSGYGVSPTTPQRIPVEKLSLGALGGSLDLGVRFTNPSYGLSSWRHRMNLGRDHYVRIVDTGFLAPWGFPAARVRVTERLVHDSSGGAGAVATLVKRQYIVVRDPQVRYAASADGPVDVGPWRDGRSLPFRSARIATLVSPELQPGGTQLGNTNSFLLLRADGNRAIFDVVATDVAGNEIDIPMALAWVPDVDNRSATLAGRVQNAWNDIASQVLFSGQRVAYAPEVVPGSCTLPTTSMRLFLTTATNAQFSTPGPDHLNLVPWVGSAEVSLDGVGAVSGSNSTTASITYTGRYLTNGFEAGEVWSQIIGGHALDFSNDRSGGMVSTSLRLQALSRKLGAVGGSPITVAQGTFEPADWFDVSGKILGGIQLTDIVQGVTDFGPPGQPGPNTVPQLLTEQLPDALEHRYVWRPNLKDSPGPLQIFEPLGDKRAEIVTTVRMSPGGGPPLTDVRSELGPAKLHLPSRSTPLIVLPFERLSYNARAGQRPDLDVEIDTDGIEFGGALDFIRGVRRYLAFGGGSGPTVELTDDAIAVDVSAELPDVKLGVFSLYDLDFSGGIEIPLDGSPMLVRFGLGSRTNPFHLTVFGIGGGGFFEIALASTGLQRMSLGLEACAEITLDFGLFSAGLGCAFGCVIDLVANGNELELSFTAYFRMWGEIDLAIASASISLYLALEYRNGDLYGRATLVVEITVLFFSESVEIEFERRFSSCDNDPPFAAYLSAAQWQDDYCTAFAPLVLVGDGDFGGVS